MKFGYDNDGKLVPIETLELARVLNELSGHINTQGPAFRTEAVGNLRRILESAGETLTVQDENVLSLFAEGILDIDNVVEHLGERLRGAIALTSGNAERKAD